MINLYCAYLNLKINVVLGISHIAIRGEIANLLSCRSTQTDFEVVVRLMIYGLRISGYKQTVIILTRIQEHGLNLSLELKQNWMMCNGSTYWI